MGKVLFQSGYALLTLFKKERILFLEWKRSCTEDEYKNIFIQAVEIGESNNVQFFLSDLRLQGPVSYSSLIWLRDIIIPKTIEKGIKKIGLIIEERFYTKIYINSLRSILEESKISINYFSNFDDAKNWFDF